MRTYDGHELHVTTYGPEDAPVAAVLAHCWTADEEIWRYQVRDLLARFGHGIRVVTWDYRGHGRSARSGRATYTIDNLARDLGAVVDTHAPTGRLVLAGHSIGGMTITALPTIRPDLLGRVAGVAFVSTSSGRLDTVTLGFPEAAGRVVRPQVARLLATRARTMSRRARRGSPTIERWAATRFFFGPDARPRDIGLAVDQLVSCDADTFAGFYDDMMTHERTAHLPAFDRIPTTVLVGSRDLLTPPRHSRRIATSIRGARMVVAPQAGHYLPLERPRLVSGELVTLVEAALAAQAVPSQT